VRPHVVASGAIRYHRAMPRRVPTRSSTPHRLAFAFLIFGLPLGALCVTEMVCRVAGYGGYPPVIERVGSDPGGVWYATSRRGTDTFFDAALSLTGGMRELQFVTPKPPGAVRIALLGESAIQGFPQQLTLTNGAFLESMLHDLWRGERRVEVLNFGATAVASFPVIRILEAVLDHEPDLIVLMVGNNEFYGAYGVASLHSAGTSPLGMRAIRAVRSLGLVQWLRSLRVRDGAAPPRGTLMERVAANRRIAHDDPLRAAASKSLCTHLASMVSRCASRGVPVIVCTVPSNERLAPIGRDLEPPLPPDLRAAFERQLQDAEQRLATDPAAAAEHARAAIALHGTHARAYFVAGEALARLGRFDEAHDAFVRARDLDTMPWRASTAANDAARAAAAGEGAVLCDLEAAFRAQSPGGAIGWDLMDDHVHMSVRGQDLFARAVVRAMSALAEPLAVRAGDVASLPDWETYSGALGRSAFSDFVAATHVKTLFEAPFMRANNAAALARFEARCDSLLAAMTPQDREAAGRWLDPSLHGIADRPIEFVVGAYRMKAGDYAGAAPLFEIARAGVPPLSSWRMELDWYLLRCARHLQDRPTQRDRQLCEEIVRVGELLTQPGRAADAGVLRHLGLAHNLLGNHAAAVAALEPASEGARGMDGWEVVAALADSYVRLGRPDDARRLLTRATRDPVVAQAAREILARIEGAQGVSRGGAEPTR
jgi:tetratricopeptide (TPR) repeat protein